MPDTSPQTRSRHRVLFLRSHATIGFAAMIAAGLHAGRNLDFAQYPPLPSHYRRRLEKFFHAEDAWQDLQRNLITSHAELSVRLSNREFDVVLLEDYNGELIRYHDMNRLQKGVGWLKRLRDYRKQALTQHTYAASFPFSFADLCRQVPVAVVDMMDHPYLSIGNIDQLRQCTAYFKRELPYDRFAMFNIRYIYQELEKCFRRGILRDCYVRRYHDFFRPWKTRKFELLPLIDNVHGIPLGIRDDVFHALTEFRVRKQDIDIFWAGEMSNTMRITAVKRLRELSQNTGWNIVIAEKPMTFHDFRSTIARSKITLSIAGGGWDCFRHCETVALGSLPFINTPTMDAVWWHGMPEAIYFENTFSNFSAQLEQLLTQEDLRQKCRADVEQLTRRHLLWSKIVEYIVRQTLEGTSELHSLSENNA